MIVTLLRADRMLNSGGNPRWNLELALDRSDGSVDYWRRLTAPNSMCAHLISTGHEGRQVEIELNALGEVIAYDVLGEAMGR